MVSLLRLALSASWNRLRKSFDKSDHFFVTIVRVLKHIRVECETFESIFADEGTFRAPSGARTELCG